MIGFDVGTMNLISCKRNDEGNLVYKREVNAFIEIPLENDFVYNMMRKTGVPLIKRNDAKVAYACGEAAMNMAYAMPNTDLRRPMKDGCVNPKERDAFEIMNTMIHSLMSNVTNDNELLYYSVPANAVNVETDADYHSKLLGAIFKAFKSETGFTVNARPINEALAIVYSEAEADAFTALGISFGSGMVNVCFSVFGAPVFAFAIANSGDWIDRQVSKATGESIVVVNKEKHKIDFTKPAETLIERAIHTQYQLMIEKTVAGIKKGLEQNSKSKLDRPVKIIVAGGTSSPNGFEKLFKDTLLSANLGIQIGDVVKPSDPIKSVATGCLIAAENASR